MNKNIRRWFFFISFILFIIYCFYHSLYHVTPKQTEIDVSWNFNDLILERKLHNLVSIDTAATSASIWFRFPIHLAKLTILHIVFFYWPLISSIFMTFTVLGREYNYPTFWLTGYRDVFKTTNRFNRLVWVIFKKSQKIDFFNKKQWNYL
jgi:hypothetical protein